MKIYVKPRSFFTFQNEKALKKFVEKHIVISINSPAIPEMNIDNEECPFPKECLNSPNLLALRFHDAELGYRNKILLMTYSDAEKARKFVKQIEKNEEYLKKDLYVHCTAGISRSGAFGEILNDYFNLYLNNMEKSKDWDFFWNMNGRRIQPNGWVKRLLRWKLFGDQKPEKTMITDEEMTEAIERKKKSDATFEKYWRYFLL